MLLKPLFDRIIVRRDPAAAVTEGGILIPEKGRPKPRRGTVIAVGPGRQLDNGRTAPMMVQEGDRVLFGPYAGNEFEPGNEDLLSMGQTEVIGILEEE